jgi:uncharacterized lipoprotein YbaY
MGQTAQWKFASLSALAGQGITVQAALPANAAAGQRFTYAVALTTSSAEVTQANNSAAGDVFIEQRVSLPVVLR